MNLPCTAKGSCSHLAALYAEEIGLVIEVAADQEKTVQDAYQSAGLTVHCIGEVTTIGQIEISVDATSCISGEFPSDTKVRLLAGGISKVGDNLQHA